MIKRLLRLGNPAYPPMRSYRALTVSSNVRSPTRKNAEQSDFLEGFLQRNKPEKPAIEHFSSIEWTRKIIDNNDYEIVPFYSRHLNQNTGENRFFATVVNTETTIPNVLALRRKDLKPSNKGRTQDSELKDHNLRNDENTSFEVLCLMSLGPDLDSHPSIANGGFQGVIFDEITWFLILLHQNATAQPGPRNLHFTLNMTTSFRGPVTTPSDVLVRAKLLKRDGRKWSARAEMLNSTGQILTTSESLWITTRER